MMVIIWVQQRLCLSIFCSLTFYFLTFHFSFTWRLFKKKKKKKKSSFIPFPLQTLTSEESTFTNFTIYMTPPFSRSWMILVLSYSSAINLTCSSILERILSVLWYGILSVSFVKEFGSLGDEPLHVNLFLKFSFRFSSFVSFSIGKGGNGYLCL